MSVAVDRPAPVTLSEFLVVWHEAHGEELALSTQKSYAGVWHKSIGPRRGWKLVQDLTPAELARFRTAIERDGAGAPYADLFDTVTERIDPDQAIREARYGTGADRERAVGLAPCARGCTESGR